jgi:transposase
MMTLEELIASDPEPRELKRALAVKMRLQGMKHHQIQPVLGVHSSYISRWESRYKQEGVAGLRSKYKGSKGYLTQTQRQEVTDWIQQENQRTLWELIDYLEKHYEVVYGSLQSYYELLKQAEMSWHRGKKKVLDTTTKWCKNTTK